MNYTKIRNQKIEEGLKILEEEQQERYNEVMQDLNIEVII
jgi:hypothetical protein